MIHRYFIRKTFVPLRCSLKERYEIVSKILFQRATILEIDPWSQNMKWLIHCYQTRFLFSIPLELENIPTVQCQIDPKLQEYACQCSVLCKVLKCGTKWCASSSKKSHHGGKTMIAPSTGDQSIAKLFSWVDICVDSKNHTKCLCLARLFLREQDFTIQTRSNNKAISIPSYHPSKPKAIH